MRPTRSAGVGRPLMAGRVQWSNGVACPGDLVMAALISGELDEADTGDVYAHADSCAACRELLVGLARAQRIARAADARTEVPLNEERTTTATIDPGTRIDHYRVLRLVGQGGMGRVFEAEDESLKRRVAIKVVRAQGDSRSAARLVREAQAMAQLSHSNVLTVYSVGTYGDDMYFAMEYIDGETLGDWMASRGRPWARVLEKFVAAGRGLQAAHEAGLVHRDFKPNNVLVDDTGRVLVTDFGLVAQRDETPMSTSGSAQQSWEGDLTQAGAVIGTPAYMAPEAFRGERADARSDQFSFCVALAEALGQHPFGDRSTQPTKEPSLTEAIPARLRRILLRGMSRDPEARFPDMAALLNELEALLRSRTRVRWIAGVLLAIGSAAGLAAYTGATFGARKPVCPTSSAWDPARREAVAARVPAELVARLDDYAQRWQAMAHEACVATRERGEASEDVLDARMVCLDGRRRSFAAVTELLAEEAVDDGVASELLRQQPRLEPCANLRLLRYLDRPSAEPEQRARIEALEAAIWRAHARGLAGNTGEAKRILAEAMPEIDAIGHKPLQAEARRITAIAATSDRREAEALLREAYNLAMVAHGDDMAANLSLSLAQRAAYDRSNAYASELWLDLARSHIERGDLELFVSELELVRGAMARAGGDHRAAAEHYGKAAAAADPPGTEAQAVALGNQAASLLEVGLAEEARAPLDQALELYTRLFGPDDVRTLNMVFNAAALHLRTGDLPRAEQELRAAHHRIRDALGPDHPTVASTLVELADVLRRTARPALARDADLEALRIRTLVYGERSPKAAECLRALAADDIALGQPTDAGRRLIKAISILEETVGGDHPDTVAAKAELATLPGSG